MRMLSFTGKHWQVETNRLPGESVAQMLLRERGVAPLGAGEILDTFGHDARTFRDWAKARDRVLRAIATKEMTGVFGDYDCDGITAACIMTRFLRRHALRPAVRLPHRLEEGYGLHAACVEEFAKAGVTLLITVDTGVTAVETIALAKKRGMEVIVLDHHSLPAELPDALAILHPELATPVMIAAPCGAGIAWSFVHAMEEELGETDWDDKETDIALATIGTVADLVELREGNRTLTHTGLLSLQSLKTGPLALLCAHAGLEAPYTSRDIGFRLAPRINAAGRMADPHIALFALLGDTASLLQLDSLNRERQDLVTTLWERLLPLAENDKRTLLFYVDDDYSPGICGLLAGKLCEHFGKPALVAGMRNGVCTASLRSVEAYDIVAGLRRCKDLLLSHGGHAMAAGCTFSHDASLPLRDALLADLERVIPHGELTPTLRAECELTLNECEPRMLDALSMLEPFGVGNAEPRFILRDVKLTDLRTVGKNGAHLQASLGGHHAIGFRLGHLLSHVQKPVDVLCHVGMNSWQGSQRFQIFVDDVRIPVSSAESQKTRGYCKGERAFLPAV